MAIVGVDSGRCRLWQPVQADSQPKSSGLVLSRRPLGTVLHSSNEPGELSQWLCHDDSTINIVLDIIIIINQLLPVFNITPTAKNTNKKLQQMTSTVCLLTNKCTMQQLKHNSKLLNVKMLLIPVM